MVLLACAGLSGCAGGVAAYAQAHMAQIGVYTAVVGAAAATESAVSQGIQIKQELSK